MSNPLKLFRKHQKVLLAVFGVALMIVFTVGSSLQLFLTNNGQGRGNDVVVTIGSEELRESDMQSLRFSRIFLRQFMRRINGVAAQRGATPQQNLGGIPDTNDERSLLQTVLLSQKAHQMGIVVSDDAVVRFLEEYTGGVLQKGDFARELSAATGGRMTQNQFFDAMRNELLAMRFMDLFRRGLIPTTPLQSWDYYQRLHRQVEIEAVPFPVAQYIDADAEFSEDVIKQAYEDGKDRYPFPSSPEPGYKRRKRIALQYIEADLEPFLNEEKAKITDEAIAAYYEENKEQFRKIDLPDESDFGTPSDGTTFPGDTLPGDTLPGDTLPGDTLPGDTLPGDTLPGDTLPGDTLPGDTLPGDTLPGDTLPGDTLPGDTLPGDTLPGDTLPGDTLPESDTESNDADTESADSGADSGETEPKYAETEGQPESSASLSRHGTLEVALLQDTEEPISLEAETPDTASDDGDQDLEKNGEKPAIDGRAADSGAEETQPNANGERETGAADDVTAATTDDGSADTENGQLDSLPDESTDEPDLTNLPDDVGDTTAATSPAEKKPEYTPLEEVADEIRTQLARGPATSRMQIALDSARGEMEAFHGDYHWSVQNVDESEDKPEPPDLNRIAAEFGLKAGSIPLMDFVEIQESDPLTGEPRYGISRAFNTNGVPFAHLAFDDAVNLYDPKTIRAHIRDVEYLYWKVDETSDDADAPAELRHGTPTLDDCRAEIIRDLRMKAALPKAVDAATKAAEQLKRSNQSPADAYRNSPDRKVIEAGPFSWMTAGNIAFNLPPRLSQISGIQYPGSDFMRDVFRLQQGQTGVATDNPHQTVYVVYLKNEVSDMDQLRNMFFRTGINYEIAQVREQDAQQALGKWYSQYEKQEGVAWKREAELE